jgi:hypothetical protein
VTQVADAEQKATCCSIKHIRQNQQPQVKNTAIGTKNLETAATAISTDRRSNNTKRSLYLQKQLELTTK